MLSTESEVRVMTFAQKHLLFTQGHTHLSHTCPQILNLQLTIKALEGSGKGGLAPTTLLHREKERDMSQFSAYKMSEPKLESLPPLSHSHMYA